jgi:hypothetical protein
MARPRDEQIGCGGTYFGRGLGSPPERTHDVYIGMLELLRHSGEYDQRGHQHILALVGSQQLAQRLPELGTTEMGCEGLLDRVLDGIWDRFD